MPSKLADGEVGVWTDEWMSHLGMGSGGRPTVEEAMLIPCS